MTESRNQGTPGPARLALLLAPFLVAGGVAAAVLWHDVLNEVLAGRPVRASAVSVGAMVLLLGASVVLLARYLRGQVSDREGHDTS